MNSEGTPPPARTFHGVILGAALLIAALGGAFVMGFLSPAQRVPRTRQGRPIVQIVRQQPGLPDIADLIDRLCPSVAVILPKGSDVAAGLSDPSRVPAFAFSADGWLVTSATHLQQLPLDAVFGDGRRAELTDIRRDPVSGLAIVKIASAATPALQLSDQAFPRVGQFGFALTTPTGAGCSAGAAMIGSDFLADGGGPAGYVRLEPTPQRWSAGMPLLGMDGRVLGVGSDDPAGAAIPGPIASVILDELIRNSLSASTSFGFRAIDYSASFSARLGEVRSGAGVAIVQSGSSADQAGLRAGDIITAVNDDPVSSASELSRALDALSSKAALTVQRRTQQLRFTIKRKASS
ncbi:MAG TPA: S1C family serine protease [Sphingomicrobium sp.]